MFESLFVAVLLLVIVADVADHFGRRRFRRAGDAFRCRLRSCGYTSAIWPRLSRRWSRRMWAMWVGDVLVVRRGPVLARTVLLRADLSPTSVYPLAMLEVTRLGAVPIAVTLRARDGSRIEVATTERERMCLVGPFLAAAVSALPAAPSPRHRP